VSRQLSSAAVAVFAALRAEQIHVIFRVEDGAALGAYWAECDYHDSTIRSFNQRGYIQKVRVLTRTSIARDGLVVVWRCGLSDAGRRAFEEAR
jgi:hypothetical protein